MHDQLGIRRPDWNGGLAGEDRRNAAVAESAECFRLFTTGAERVRDFSDVQGMHSRAVTRIEMSLAKFNHVRTHPALGDVHHDDRAALVAVHLVKLKARHTWVETVSRNALDP